MSRAQLIGTSAAVRILATAMELFSKSGFNGTTTREIASAAGVNEVTIFRQYPRKHDLCVAAMKSALEEVSVRGDLLTAIAEAPDGHTALVLAFELVTQSLIEKPNVLRLLQFSALELSEDFNPLARKHLGEFVGLTARYLDPWIKSGELRCPDSRAIVYTLIAIVASYSALQSVFDPEGVGASTMLRVYAEFHSPSGMARKRELIVDSAAKIPGTLPTLIPTTDI